MSESNSSYRQPIISLGVPDNDVVNRAIWWVMCGVSFVFLLTILVFAVSNADEGTSEEGAPAPAATLTEAVEAAAADD